ncbi:pyridoxamine 5'-phosphate oxidase family protein [Streptomyces malaysiensis]|uniref:Pyridoxamine 5'-phosphate oxidase family protein n=1 Tax=Streptomyces malaysiensis subsp. samsunensis TaxID=459658 RepID=A0A9X2M3M3_STRMQ|nr:pyridoxamine 5'-phosphate oxidase family protein [Streptomyces samsunensis]MCQ8834220.1 pyridoxamine 5'-phosphate oxidase family protein [Streptomyces samsunensis]
MPEIRSAEQRKADALHRFEKDIDLWVASADANAAPTLVPLSFSWDGEGFLVATARSNPTARNIVEHGTVRVMLGHSRDVVLIAATAHHVSGSELRDSWHAKYVKKQGWDPREMEKYEFYRLVPRTVETWRQLNEHADRFIMRDGKWLI